ncbi:MAG TPA: DNA replication and repair protein RecF, partial [Armatimonadetes bacterium]|nr:DNA replication and repair protein RecF [Armatimonadota bacterium]
MYLQSLTLENFRCYERAELEFRPGLNVILGPNASGKTTLLEAIY